VGFEVDGSISRCVESQMSLALVPSSSSLKAKTECSDVDLGTGGRFESSTHKRHALQRCRFIRIAYASLQAG
jgi:hypothetical protein